MGNFIFMCAQDSILGPLLFSICICDIFSETPANTDSLNTEKVLDNRQGALEKMFLGFQQITW